MTTCLDIIDSAVKIGLGALIAGTFTYIQARKSHNEALEKLNYEDKQSLLKEAALKIELIESKANSAAFSFHSGNLSEAKSEAMLGVNEAYSVAALTNLAGSQELLEISEKLSEKMESIYHELNSVQPSEEKLCELDKELSNLKQSAYTHFRSSYGKNA